MREDMSKVLVERPRTGGCGKTNLRINRRDTRLACKKAIDDADVETTNYRSMKHVHFLGRNSWGDKKELNENLRPLRRFLLSKVGQSWDKVYSEIMSGINLNNAVQYHVWQHLIQFGEVHTKTYMENGNVMAAGIIGPEQMTNQNYIGSREEFYVDPRDGTLRCTEKSKKSNYLSYKDEKKKRLDECRYINKKKPLVQYHMLAGVWYEYQMRAATEDELKNKSFGFYDKNYNIQDIKNIKISYKWVKMFENNFVKQLTQDDRVDMPSWKFRENLWFACETLFGGAFLPISKRQISSREVKKVEAMMAERKHSKKAA